MAENRGGLDLHATLDTLTKNGLALLLAFVFSTALVGGSGFVLFEAPNQQLELNEKRDALNLFLAEGAQMDAFLGYIGSASWFADRANEERLTAILRELYDAAGGQLGADQARADFNFLLGATQRLSTDQGTLAAYIFSDDYFNRVRSSTIDTFISTRKSALGMQQAVLTWNQLSLTERQNLLVAMAESLGDEIAAWQQVALLGQRAARFSELRRATYNQRLAEVENLAASWRLRTGLSWIGIATGLLIFGGLAAYLISGLVRNRQDIKQT